MFLITMRWNKQDLILLAVLAVVAAGLGLLETLQLTFRKKPSAKKKSGWIYEMRRGWPYVAGWAAVIILGLGLSDLIQHAGFYHLFIDKIFETIFEEINPLSLFTQTHPWYIWALSSISSLVFIWRGTEMLKKAEAEGTTPVMNINPLSLFTQTHPWYIWALSSISSLVFIWRGTEMLKKAEAEGTTPVMNTEEARDSEA